MTRRYGWVAVLLGALLAFVMPAAPVLAAPVSPHPAALIGDIEVTRTATVTIHKFSGMAGETAKQRVASAGVPGVVFTVRRIDGVDLTTTAGWDQAWAYYRDLDSAESAPGRTWTTPPTDRNGITTLSGLPIGLYFVTESTTPPGVVAARDALLTLPMADPENSSRWLYDVDLYPKPGLLSVVEPSIVKTVRDGDSGVPNQDAPVAGRVLTYTLTASTPSPGLAAFGGSCERAGTTDQGAGLDGLGFNESGFCADGATWTGTAGGATYRIVDDLTTMAVPGTTHHTSDYLALLADPAPVVRLSRTTAPLTVCTDAAKECDYRLTLTASRLQVDLTDRGMGLLAQAQVEVGEAEIEVLLRAKTLPTIITATTVPSGTLDDAGPGFVLELPNQAQLQYAGPSGGRTAPILTDVVVTVYGALRLHKVDSSTGEALRGAVFTLYRTRDDALAQRNPLGVTEPTDGRGLTQLAGLHVTDFQNNGADDDSYWAVETLSPDGYVGLSGPFEVKVLRDGTTVGADATRGYPVANTRGGGWLPSTGSDVSLTLLAGAASAIAVGVALVGVGRRRRLP